jgi:HEXXH motif-containing protein
VTKNIIDRIARAYERELHRYGQGGGSCHRIGRSAQPRKEESAVSIAAAPNVHALLWESSEASAARQRKARDALRAIAAVLRDRAPLGGGEQEFLDLLATLDIVSPAADRAIGSTPQAYGWVRRGFDLVRAVCRADAGGNAASPDSARPDLIAHLEDFKRFALAVACTERFDLVFEQPFAARLPLDLPGTPWTLIGEGPVAIDGFVAGSLVAHQDGLRRELPLAPDGGQPDRRLGLHACPVIEHEGCKLFLKPHAFQSPELTGASAPIEAGLSFHRRHEALVRAAVEAIHRHDPETFAHLRDDISIIGLKPPGAGGYGNTTFSRMPGAFVTSPCGSPLALADDLVHETYHNRLFAIEEEGSFFADAAARRDARHYSPWRHDPRPLFGVFHAFYVFTRVMRFWRLVYGDLTQTMDTAESGLRGYALDRLVRLRGQLTSARDTLHNGGGFTPWGGNLFAATEAEFNCECRLLQAIGLPDDTPAVTVADDGSFHPQAGGRSDRSLTVREALREHREGFDRGVAAARAAQESRSR